MPNNPRKISVKTSVKDGKILEHRKLVIEAIESFEGKQIKVTIERYFKSRSNKQVRYYFGVIIEHWINLIREEWGEIWTKDEMHEFLKSNLNYEEYVNEDTGEMVLNPETNLPIRKPKSTKDNTTIKQEDYHKACRDLAFNMFQYQIPLPDHKLKATF